MANGLKHGKTVPLIGSLAVKNQFISEEQLQKALAQYSDDDNLEEKLTAYFLAENLISSRNIHRLTMAAKAVTIHQQEYRFGAIALAKGFVNKSVLDLALEEQKEQLEAGKKPRRIGDVMVEAGIITSKQRDEIFKLQNRSCKPPHGANEPLPKTEPVVDAQVLSHEEDPANSGHHTHNALADNIPVSMAQGVKASPDKDTKTEFFFDTDYLKTGGMDDYGNIDFKDRSPSPLVEKGTVLAEKIVGSTPQPGNDVYGNAIPAIDKTNNSFRVGAGAILSEDGRKVLATVRGEPRITLAGLIVVHEEFDINEDIDNETGPVEFDGNISVTGSIKSGARVCGVDIAAQEVNNGVVEANGDLIIARGINDARVYARGNVYAQSITNSEIICMGDVFVKKKIVDAKIECSGACSIITGMLVSSQVSAKMGLMAGSISSGTAVPSKIRVGRDAFTARELEKNSAETMRLEEVIQTLGKTKNTILRKAAGIKKKMAELDQVKEKIQVQCREIESRPELPPGDREYLDEGLTGLRKRLKAAETKIKLYTAKIKDLAKQAAKIDQQISEPVASKKALADEKKNLIRWSEHTPGKARVIVDGEMMSGTALMGLHSRFVSDTQLYHVRITERPVKSDDGEDSRVFYQMQVDDF
nr:FapA family protein [uncultured Desulfobacter sp.]